MNNLLNYPGAKWGMAASTTSKDWGNAVAGKGGKTRNAAIPESRDKTDRKK